MAWVVRNGKPVRITASGRTAAIRAKAKELAHWHIVRDASEEGTTLEEAAKRAGMTVKGVKNLCYRKVGSTRWPPQLKEIK